MDPVIVQKRNRSSVRGDKSINKRPKGTDVASRYQATSSEPRANCVLTVVTALRHGETLREQCECFLTQRLFLVCSGEKACV